MPFLERKGISYDDSFLDFCRNEKYVNYFTTEGIETLSTEINPQNNNNNSVNCKLQTWGVEPPVAVSSHFPK